MGNLKQHLSGLCHACLIFITLAHRHLRIYRLLKGSHRLPCLLFWYCKWPQQQKKRKEEAYPWKACASIGHTTNLKQSILRLLLSMLWPQRHLLCVPYSPSKLMQRLKKQLKTGQSKYSLQSGDDDEEKRMMKFVGDILKSGKCGWLQYEAVLTLRRNTSHMMTLNKICP
jgi:hypothetical protein